ncbi:hypothetical protein GALMADRAFT_144721 [Galerina marginata CBS 339.88]|uniref:CHAT domain-containing protein n=1 Tax=Galerina marginata (strain CBS 339.88) TaxID=685588 RepID=A0A067SHP4_GALM3|nr:hypothetical protein GALMADRAFT_144721 [Galerina marginata CBS 339.88]
MSSTNGGSEQPSGANAEMHNDVPECYLKDIHIEFVSDDPELSSPNETKVHVDLVVPGSTSTENLPFKKLSSREWKSDREIKVPDELIFVAKFHEIGPIWKVHFGKSEIEKFKSNIGIYKTTRDFTTEDKCVGIWKLKFDCDTFVLNRSFKFAYQSSGNLKDLDDAVLAQQEAVQSTPEGHEDMPDHLNNLGISLSGRFKHTGNLSDIDAAISAYQEAIRIADEEDPLLPLYLNNLGNAFSSRFERTSSLIDIRASVLAYRRAVELTPEESSWTAEYLNCLGSSLRQYFNQTADPFYREMAVSKYSLAATGLDGDPSERLDAAEHWAELSQNDDDPSQVLSAFDTAIRLVSQVAGLDQTIEMRHSNLASISHLSRTAATAALRFMRTDLAVEWLEQGRGLVWSQLNNLRTPLDRLSVAYPVLTNEIKRISRALEDAGGRGEPALEPIAEASIVRKRIGVDEEIHAHIKLAREWDQTLEKVRAIPEFEDFLQPLKLSSMVDHLPNSGYVIIINVHQDRCDALALQAGVHDLCHIPLLDFSYAKADDLRNRLKDHLLDSGLRMRGSDSATISRGMRYEGRTGDVIKDVLRDLWILVVRPILDGIGQFVSNFHPIELDSFDLEIHAQKPPSDLSRIWWCATGPLAFLPIHAAGIYDGSTSSTLSDFAISSYIPTVKTLIERVKTPRNADTKKAGLFMISQPDTPNQLPIPGTTKEVRAIQRLLEKKGIRVLCLERASATVNHGIANMEKYSCVHFACHAFQNTEEPLKSGFILHDGRVELATVIQKHSVGADLAFLSACQTSTGDEKLSEEAVHLAAGMLAAGYRGVVATMWSIQDKYGPKIAEDFYANLIERPEGLGSDAAARALHHATQNLRKILGDSESSLVCWVPYVHFGL